MKINGKYRHTAEYLICCLVFALVMIVKTGYADAEPAGHPAVDPVGHSENYSAVLYDNTKGLPISEANDIAQSREGFIWIATYAGLLNYDGNTFNRIVYNDSMKSVTCLFVDSEDKVWIGSNDSGVSVLSHSGIKSWDEKDGLPSDRTRGFAEDEKGNIYIGSSGGVSIITPDMELVRLDDPRIENVMVDRVDKSADGLICFMTSDLKWFSVRDKEVVEYVDLNDLAVKNISCVVPDPETPGSVMIGTEDCGFYRGDMHGELEDFEHVDITPLLGAREIKVFGDQIWIGALNGIGMIDGDGFHSLTDLPLNNSVTHIITDYEGNLWFSSTRQGIMKIVPNRFTDIFAQCGLEESVVNSTCISDDLLFIGSDKGLSIVKDNQPLSEFPLRSAVKATGEYAGFSDLIGVLKDCRVRSVIKDSKGRLWISTWGSLGLLCYDDGDVTVYDETSGMVSNYVRTVCEEADGTILAACTGGINVISGGKVTGKYGKEEGISNIECLSVTAAPNGDRLVASNGAGIYIISGDSVRSVGKKEGLGSNIVMRIKHDPKRHVFWIVTGNSLAYMTEDYKITTISNFPYSDNFDLYESKNEDMWVISGDGIHVAPVSQLLENKNINPVYYGLANGLRSEATANSYSQLSDNGDLYICCRSGVNRVNIDEPMEIIDDLRMAVPFIDVDGVRKYPDKDGNFTISSEAKKLTIYPYVFNYSLTDPQVSYQLKGFDNRVVTMKRSDLDSVSYTNLPGREYVFNLELKDALGHSSKTLPVKIVKEKAYFEQPWFFALVVLLVGSLAIFCVREYTKKRIAEVEEKHREETERERVSNELHLANRIQTSMLPHEFPPFPDRKEFDIYASMDPAREVGGDFYDFFFVDEEHLCLVMADVSGKGIPGAMFMMNSKVMLQNLAGAGNGPAELLTKANESICRNNETEMFVTVWLGILDLTTGKIMAANAGHEYPAIRHSGSGYELYRDKHGFVVGGMEGIRYKEYELELGRGDSLFLYTDGVPEATNSREEMFGTDRMLAALNIEPDASPEQTLANVRSAVDDFVQDYEQFDDLTMLCIRYNGGDGESI